MPLHFPYSRNLHSLSVFWRLYTIRIVLVLRDSFSFLEQVTIGSRSDKTCAETVKKNTENGASVDQLRRIKSSLESATTELSSYGRTQKWLRPYDGNAPARGLPLEHCIFFSCNAQHELLFSKFVSSWNAVFIVMRLIFLRIRPDDK
jgi:hypothetical protein